MNRIEFSKKYLIFSLGLFINAIGVVFVTKANLGTSPNASIPYVLSMALPLTIGQFTILLNLLLIGLQFFITRRQFPLVQLLQIPVSIAFGYLIDFCMDYLFYWINPEGYATKMAFLLIGCIILAFSVFLEFTADVIVLPGEGLTNAIHAVTGWEKGVVKVSIDAAMSGTALLFALYFFHAPNGVREGTIIAAILVGIVSKQFDRMFGKRLLAWIHASGKATPQTAAMK